MKDKRQQMIIITLPTVIFNAREVFEQQGLGHGYQSNNMFYMSLQATIDTHRKNQSRK
jgi:hypothetical protein